MKYLITLLISFNVFAGAFAPIEKSGFDERTYPKFHETELECVNSEGEPCYDIAACPLYKCNLIDEEVNDKPIYSDKINPVACATEEECETFRLNLCDTSKNELFFYAIKDAAFEAYCVTITGWTRIKTGKKLLVEDSVKLATHQATIQAKKDQEDNKKEAKRLLKEKLKALKKSDLTSNAKTVDALMDIIELLKE
jgi:hypothetical protein